MIVDGPYDREEAERSEDGPQEETCCRIRGSVGEDPSVEDENEGALSDLDSICKGVNDISIRHY